MQEFSLNISKMPQKYRLWQGTCQATHEALGLIPSTQKQTEKRGKVDTHQYIFTKKEGKDYFEKND